MQKEMVLTKDGSHTVRVPGLNVTYHSMHGAVQESMHVFIQEGLRYALELKPPETLRIFEMGFGTGLNALLSAIEAEGRKIKIVYTSIERCPLSPAEAETLNHGGMLGAASLFRSLHEAAWNREERVSENFILHKMQADLLDTIFTEPFDLIFYDAFAPSAQPELWTKEVFEKLYAMLAPGGILTTYCSKSDARRAMVAAGFHVTKRPGPPGKREMVRAERR